MSTVRGLVKSVQKELRDGGELHPERAAQLLTQLTALLGNVLEEIRDADVAYATVLLKHLDSEEAANRAKIRAETTPEYLRKQEAKDMRELVIEMIRSLKYILKAQTEEMRLAR